MPLAITVRRGPDSSPFRRQLLCLCRMPRGGNLVLCSGYIYEPDRGYSILDDQLLNAIVRETAGYRVQTLAGKLQQSGTMDWLGYYRNFVATLRDAGVQVELHIAPERNWHAKVAVRFDTTGQPRAAIVGSSNLPGPAMVSDAGRGTTSATSRSGLLIPP